MKAHDLQTIIIGGGVVGLACAIELVDANQKVLVIEARQHLGGRFADSRQLVDEFTDYIERHNGEIVVGTKVRSLELKDGGKEYAIKTEWGTVTAQNTILALGPDDQANLKLPAKLPGLLQLHQEVRSIRTAILEGQKLAQAILNVPK